MTNKNKVCGIIAEYNPFHNGHKYQLDMVKETFDTTVVVMSGSFTQRGDVAITDKWSRAKSALICGADLVIELPTVFAMNTAERFAFGGVSILNSLGCVDAISFGSECGDIEILKKAAQQLIGETPEQKKQIKALLKSGRSYASAREAVFSEYIPEGILNSPNNILAVEYIKHLILSGSSITPITHRRQGADYKSIDINSQTASASAIRANIDSHKVKKHMPADVYDIFKAVPKHNISRLDTAAVCFIRQNGAKVLSRTLECGEGLENRIYDAARKYSTIERIADECSTKRYTKAKIRRIILSSLLGITEDFSKKPPSYIRILGATSKGRELLGVIKSNSKLPIITKTADFKQDNLIFEKDVLATDIWALSTDLPDYKTSGADFTNSPMMI